MIEVAQDRLPLAEIDVSGRLRQIDEAHAQLLAENIREVGRLRQPIEVRKRKGGGYKLIAGGHRYRACQIIGRTEIEAFVFEASDDEALLAEIDENLVRHDLNPLDRAVFLYERKTVYERLHPETRNGAQGGKGGKRNETDIVSFSKDTAQRCGMDERTVRRSVAIARISPELRSRISGTWLARHQGELGALSKLGPDMQAKVVGLLLADDPKARTVKGAWEIIHNVRKVEKSPFEKRLETMQSAWSRADGRARMAFMAWLDERGDLALSGYVKTRRGEG